MTSLVICNKTSSPAEACSQLTEPKFWVRSILQVGLIQLLGLLATAMLNAVWGKLNTFSPTLLTVDDRVVYLCEKSLEVKMMSFYLWWYLKEKEFLIFSKPDLSNLTDVCTNFLLHCGLNTFCYLVFDFHIDVLNPSGIHFYIWCYYV